MVHWCSHKKFPLLRSIRIERIEMRVIRTEEDRAIRSDDRRGRALRCERPLLRSVRVKRVKLSIGGPEVDSSVRSDGGRRINSARCPKHPGCIAICAQAIKA